MSLDVYLEGEATSAPEHEAIFVRRDGRTVEISLEEWRRLNPDGEPVTVMVGGETTELYSDNITHNLGHMADEAGIYKHLWRPDEIGITKANELIQPLAEGLAKLRANPDYFRTFNPANGWGTYEALVRFAEQYLAACLQHPEANVRVSR